MEYITILKDVFAYSKSTINWASVVLFLTILMLLAKRFDRNRYIEMGFPSLRLGLFDLTGHVKSIPRGSLYTKLHPQNVYVYQILTGYAHLFRKEKFFSFWMGIKPYVMLIHPDSVESLLSSTKVLQKASTYFVLHPWLGMGLLTSNGDKWKTRRKLLTSSFHFEILKEFLPVVNQQSRILVEKLKGETDKDWIDVVEPITLCSLDVICETTLGVPIRAQKDPTSEYVKSVLRTSSTVMIRAVDAYLWPDIIFYNTSMGRTFKRDVAVLHKFARNTIEKKRETMLAIKDGVDADNVSKRKALMDLLMDRHLNIGDITTEDIREEIDTFAFAGHDTTSMGISWTLYLIGLYPEIQQKVHDEQDMIFHGYYGDMTVDDLNGMKYLECVIKESQRLYPSVPLFAREVTKETIIGGCKVPEGTVCTVLTVALHRNPDIYPKPEIFDPDRFLPENSAGRHPYAFIPFSAGPRNCIGQRFAMMEMKCILASVLREFDIRSLEHRDKIAPSTDLILRSMNPIKIQFSLRKSE